ncbi:ATP-binding protein [Actinomadura vinacea]|uniref:ATP-binding protein n=1 Tax=Actinomadura vinacea TaxID=115336 RepID=UPI0031DE5C91
MKQVKDLLAANRLVTLTGVGGVGKTRLALKVAEDLRRGFADGVWLVNLTGLQEPGLVVQAITRALGLRDEVGRWDPLTLVDHLEGQQLLIVLDNCEHLLDACAQVVGTLLRGTYDVRILATSRQPLSVTGEHIVQVPPLSLPDRDGPPPPDQVARYDSVRLFTERAAQVQPGFAVDRDNCATVSDVCWQLEGIPLAIELAAVRLRVLSLGQLREGLRDRYRLLTAGWHDMPPRQRTLRALIDWSFQLCSASERTMWARVSVFRGGFDLDAAAAVCSGRGVPVEDVLDLVSSLIDKSVLLREEHRGWTRYRMLETLREYGAAVLAESGETDAVLRRHRDYYQQLAQQVSEAIFGPDQLTWFTRLRLDHANLRVAMESCLADPAQADTVLRVAAGLRSYWLVTGYLSEGRRWLDQALAVDTRPTRTRAMALWVDAWLALMQGDLDTARPLLKESEELARQLRDKVAGAWAAQLTGYAAMGAGELAEADSRYREALPLHRAAGDDLGILCTLDRMAVLAALTGNTAAGVPYCEEALALCEARGERFNRAVMLWVLSLLYWRQGDTPGARAAATDSIRLALPFDDPIALARAVEVLAWIAADEHPEQAATLLGALDRLWRSFGGALFLYLRRYHEACEARVHEALGPAGYRTAYERGVQLPDDRLLALVLGEEAPPAPAATEESAAVLTPREWQIAELITQGLSNKQIAARLVIAPRTAEGHVEHILTKLGFTSRAQIAAWAVGQQPVRQ